MIYHSSLANYDSLSNMIRQLTGAYDGNKGEALQMILLGSDELESQMVTTAVEYFEDETNCQLYLEPLSIKDTAEYFRFFLHVINSLTQPGIMLL